MKGLDPGQVHALDISRLGSKDAFHLPGLMCSSANVLYPGDNVQIVNDVLADGKALCSVVHAVKCHPDVAHGVVDPMIPYGPIYSNTMFWVFLKREFIGPVTHHFDVKVPDVQKVLPSRPQATRPLRSPSYDDDDGDECRGCS